MKIVVLGAGAMGALIGGYLSKHNDVWLVDISKPVVDTINANGIVIKEKDGTDTVLYPHACVDSSSIGKANLVIVFVKSMFTVSALQTNKAVIDDNTYIMTLQNGAGHESKLLPFADRSHVIIGSTQHNSSILGLGLINHGGSGITSIGLLDGNTKALKPIADTFNACNLDCVASDNVQWQIWHKLFTNTSASALTAIYRVPLGAITANSEYDKKMRTLAKEAVTVANALGLAFDYEKVVKEIEDVCNNAPNGYTSIYSDIVNGRKTEVDTISGSVVEAAKQLGISVPCHEWVVDTVHDMEKAEKTRV